MRSNLVRTGADEGPERRAPLPYPQLDQGKPRAARDVPVGESWVFRDHRSLAEIIAMEAP